MLLHVISKTFFATALSFCILIGGIECVRGQDAENARVNGVELLKDARFRNGFQIAAPIEGQNEAGGLMQPRSFSGKPEWKLCQWHSKFDLSDANAEELDSQTLRCANRAKAVVLSSSLEGGDLILSVDARPEYNGAFREDGQPWPHFLVQQIIEPIHLLKDIEGLEFEIDALLLKDDRVELEGYEPLLHSASFMVTFIVQNRNQESPGFLDFIWFNIAMFDERTKFCELYATVDVADPSAKMIYAPPSKRFSNESLHDGEWVTFSHEDLGPILEEAIGDAHKKGFLKQSPDPGDFAISSVILGWEVTGISDVSMQVRNFSIKLR